MEKAQGMRIDVVSGTRDEIDRIRRNKIVFISWSPDEGTLVFVGGIT